MGQQKRVRLAITARNQEEADRIRFVVHSNGFSLADTFINPRHTYHVASRSQYDIFITCQNFHDMSGLTLIQSLRGTGNYGLESHLVLVDSLDSELMVVLAECNIRYVIQKPFNSEHISQKLESLWKEECHLPPAEIAYREAHAAFHSGLSEMAMNLTAKFIKDNKPNEKCLLLLGDIFSKLEKYEEAGKVYEKAREIFPQSYVAAHKIARLLMEQKRDDEAVLLLDDLARLSPLNLEILANTGLANFEIGQYEESRAAMLKLKQLDRERKDANQILARIAIREGNYESSFRILVDSHTAIELCEVLHREAEAMRKQNSYVRVIDFYLKHIEMMNDHPFLFDLYYRLGLAYQDIFDQIQAKRCLEKALEHEPSYEPAAAALSQLTTKI